MQTRKLRVRIVVEKEFDRTSPMFGAIIRLLETSSPERVNDSIIGSLRKKEHESLWGDSSCRITIAPVLLDDSVGQCCASCANRDLEGDYICRYNQSLDLTKCCDFHEWDPARITCPSINGRRRRSREG